MLQKITSSIKEALSKININASIDDFDQAWTTAENNIETLLPVFGCDLESSSKNLVQSALSSFDIFIDDKIQDRKFGLSGLPLLFARSAEKTCAVIKAFPLKRRAFAKELWAQHNLAEVTNNVPRILGAGICDADHGRYFLLASEYIDAILVDDAIREMASVHDGIERRKRLERISHMIHKLGTLLGTLHVSGENFYGERTYYIKECHQRALEISVNGLANENLGIKPAQLQLFAEHIMNRAEHHEYRYSFIHGDSHPGNYIYETTNDRIIILDFEDGAFSFASDGAPRGCSFIDYMRITASLEIRKIFGVNDDEINFLKTTFDESYAGTGAKIPTSTITEFYQTMEIVSYFAWYFSHEKELAEGVKYTMREIFSRGAAWIANALTQSNFSLRN